MSSPCAVGGLLFGPDEAEVRVEHRHPRMLGGFVVADRVHDLARETKFVHRTSAVLALSAQEVEPVVEDPERGTG